MTSLEACELVAQLTREVSALRGERDAWRLVAVAGLHHGHELHVELERVRARYHAVLKEAA